MVYIIGIICLNFEVIFLKFNNLFKYNKNFIYK